MTSLTFFKNQHLFFLGSRKRIFLHIVYNHKSKAFSSLTHFPFNNKIFLLPRYPIILTSFRFMRSSAQAVKHVLNPSCNLHLSKFHHRSFARRTLNAPDNNSPEPALAFKNNPFYGKNKTNRHYECHVQECDKTDCKTQDCAVICGNPTTRKAVGHPTHGQSPATETDKVTYPLSTTDMEGNQKQQNIVIYKKAHEVNTTKEHAKGTAKMDADAGIKKTIIDHEDKT